MSELSELAERMENFEAKVRSICREDSGLSPSGAATALALLVTMELSLFSAAAASLRARSGEKE